MLCLLRPWAGTNILPLRFRIILILILMLNCPLVLLLVLVSPVLGRRRVVVRLAVCQLRIDVRRGFSLPSSLSLSLSLHAAVSASVLYQRQLRTRDPIR